MKHSPYPKVGLAFALALGSRSLGPWNVLINRSVIVCLGVLATRQCNNVIYDGHFRPHIIIPLEELETKGISLTSGMGWRLKISRLSSMWSSISKYSGHPSLGRASLVGSTLCILSHTVAEKSNDIQDSMGERTTGSSVFSSLPKSLWVSSSG